MKRVKKYLIYLKEKWEIESNKQLIIILIVFAITGTSSLFVKKYFLEFSGIELSSIMTPFNYVARIFITLFFYQFLLVGIGAIFGQFNFFWKFEKKILRRLIPGFGKKNRTTA